MSGTDGSIPPLSLDEIYRRLDSLKQLDDIDILYYPLHYHRGDYLFPKITSKGIGSSDRVIMVGAGVHGNEIAGPMTLALHAPDIVRHARSKNLKIILYPLRNPSGYGSPGKRYNVDTDDDEAGLGNNDFVRYQLADGRIVDDLRDGKAFESWSWSSDTRLHITLPVETRLMHDLLRQDPLHSVQAAIDLHQDWITRDLSPLAYHYGFGDLSVYQSITDDIERIIPIAAHRRIGAGYRGITADGSATRDAPEQALECDGNGFIVRHDGTWTDLMVRIGESQGRRIHSVTPETAGSTPLDLACRVNLIWIYGIMDLVAAES